jgi:hypothetical protein
MGKGKGYKWYAESFYKEEKRKKRVQAAKRANDSRGKETSQEK